MAWGILLVLVSFGKMQASDQGSLYMGENQHLYLRISSGGLPIGFLVIDGGFKILILN